jgi:hypothetical protein
LGTTRFRDRRTLAGVATLAVLGLALLAMAGSASATHDPDGDLIPEESDNCPGVFNPDQYDADADGRGNTCDDSKGIPADQSHFIVYFRDQKGRQVRPCVSVRLTGYSGTEVLENYEICAPYFERGFTVDAFTPPDFRYELAQVDQPPGCTGGITSPLQHRPTPGVWRPVEVRYRCGTATPPGGPATGTPTGTVLLNGRPFLGGPVPFGARVDVTKGTLRLVTQTGTLLVEGRGTAAIFVLVRGTDQGKPVTELRLAGGNFGVCTRALAAVSAVRPPPKLVRHLWAKGKGRFRTRGRYAAATVRGTGWLTADRCDGTLTKVTQGTVQVADLPRRKTVLVRAGNSYLAKKPQ